MKIKLDNKKTYIIEEFSIWIFHFEIKCIGIRKMYISLTIKWGW